jgi:hypothetical protein
MNGFRAWPSAFKMKKMLFKIPISSKQTQALNHLEYGFAWPNLRSRHVS